jgi:hypothetical protein
MLRSESMKFSIYFYSPKVEQDKRALESIPYFLLPGCASILLAVCERSNANHLGEEIR